MKVKVINRYLDIERAEIMEPDQKFEVKDEARVQKLVQLGYVEVVETPVKKAPEKPAPEPAEEPKPAPKKTTRKKKTE